MSRSCDGTSSRRCAEAKAALGPLLVESAQTREKKRAHKGLRAASLRFSTNICCCMSSLFDTFRFLSANSCQMCVLEVSPVDVFLLFLCVPIFFTVFRLGVSFSFHCFPISNIVRCMPIIYNSSILCLSSLSTPSRSDEAMDKP